MSEKTLLEEEESHSSRTQSYFDQSLLIRLLIGVVFGTGLFFFFHLKIPDQPFVLVPDLGTGVMSLIFLLVGGLYLYQSHTDLFHSSRKLALFSILLLLTLLIAKLTEFFLIPHLDNPLNFWRFPLFVPFAAILLSATLSRRVATFGSVFLAVILMMGLNVHPIPFFVTNVLAAVVAILAAKKVRKRKDIFVISAWSFFAAITAIIAFNLQENTTLSFTIFGDILVGFIYLALTAILAIGLLPFFETLFKIMTDITLMEYLDPSHELLRRLTLEAPGTYQHSMVVGSLSEAAANAVGANGLFCRVASQYHDVGKLVSPQYFTENQLAGVDMHQLLTPLESAEVIIAHVSEGVAMARKVGLPEQFIDIIKEHHGTTLVYYFYHKQIENVGGDKTQVDEQVFRYAGPKPRTKESTIIMIADTLEAAARSLDEFTEESITELVDALVSQKAADGQFSESLLTFKELGMVKRQMIKNLLIATHPRIKYPPHHPGEEG